MHHQDGQESRAAQGGRSAVSAYGTTTYNRYTLTGMTRKSEHNPEHLRDSGRATRHPPQRSHAGGAFLFAPDPFPGCSSELPNRLEVSGAAPTRFPLCDRSPRAGRCLSATGGQDHALRTRADAAAMRAAAGGALDQRCAARSAHRADPSHPRMAAAHGAPRGRCLAREARAARRAGAPLVALASTDRAVSPEAVAAAGVR